MGHQLRAFPDQPISADPFVGPGGYADLKSNAVTADVRTMKLVRLVGAALIVLVASPVASGAAVPIKRVVINMPDPFAAAVASPQPQPAARPKAHTAKHRAVHQPSAH